MDSVVIGQDRAAQKDAAQSVVSGPERSRLDCRALPAGDPDTDERPPVGEHSNAVDEIPAPDRVEDDVHAVRICQLLDALDEALRRVVDSVVESEPLEPLELVVAG